MFSYSDVAYGPFLDEELFFYEDRTVLELELLQIHDTKRGFVGFNDLEKTHDVGKAGSFDSVMFSGRVTLKKVSCSICIRLACSYVVTDKLALRRWFQTTSERGYKEGCDHGPRKTSQSLQTGKNHCRNTLPVGNNACVLPEYILSDTLQTNSSLRPSQQKAHPTVF